jgi:putative endonuclease
MKKWHWYVYIIECMDGLFYTGLTWKPELRFDQHLLGLGGKFTALHKVKGLVYLEQHDNIEVARQREKQIKNWNRNKN